MRPTTLFMFGYSGWGTATKELVRAVDTVERKRGFRPPVFVDIRISRGVRAKGFSGRAFEKLVGESRHHWMKSLGNRKAQTGNGPDIQIAEPMAANTLLDLAQEAAADERRLVFFCSCPFPKKNGKVVCHRWAVGTLLIGAAKKRKEAVALVEWPGGEPGHAEVKLSPDEFEAVEQGRGHLPVGKALRPEFAGLPWGSLATVHLKGKDKTVCRIVGPAVPQKDGWALPVLSSADDPEMDRSQYERQATKLRKSMGLESRTSR